MLWLVGAGPGRVELLTDQAVSLLSQATAILADASLHPLVRELRPDAPLALPGEPSSWPIGAGGADDEVVVRLLPGDGLTASGPARAVLDALGRAYDLAPGVQQRAIEAVEDALGATLAARRPLRGLTITITRPEAQQRALAQRLRALGAAVVALSSTRIAEPADGGAGLRAALDAIERYDWLVVTSANGARRVLGAVADLRRLAGVRVAAIGPATAAVLTDARLPVDLLPAEFVAEALLDAFPSPPATGGRVLLARAAVARATLPDGLAAAGWEVEVVEAYRTVDADVEPAAVAAAAASDVVTFTAPSSVRRYSALVAGAGAGAVGRPAFVAIGPVTGAALRDAGLVVAVQAERFDLDGLVEAVLHWATSHRP